MAEQKKWENMTIGEKITGTTILVLAILIVIGGGYWLVNSLMASVDQKPTKEASTEQSASNQKVKPYSYKIAKDATLKNVYVALVDKGSNNAERLKATISSIASEVSNYESISIYDDKQGFENRQIASTEIYQKQKTGEYSAGESEIAYYSARGVTCSGESEEGARCLRIDAYGVKDGEWKPKAVESSAKRGSNAIPYNYESARGAEFKSNIYVYIGEGEATDHDRLKATISAAIKSDTGGIYRDVIVYSDSDLYELKTQQPSTADNYISDSGKVLASLNNNMSCEMKSNNGSSCLTLVGENGDLDYVNQVDNWKP